MWESFEEKARGWLKTLFGDTNEKRLKLLQGYLETANGLEALGFQKDLAGRVGEVCAHERRFDGDAGDAVSGCADGVDGDEGISGHGHGRYFSGTCSEGDSACHTIWMTFHCLPSKTA